MITVLFVPGTFETQHSTGVPAGMLRGVAVGLPKSRFVCKTLLYPMAYGNPISYEESVEIGVRNLLTAIRNDPNPVVLVGFSQGATIVARVAAEIRDGKHPDLDVRMVVTIANPERAWGEGVLNVKGSGVAGGRSLARCPFPVVQLAIKNDVITAASKDSMVRTIADLTDFMSPNVGLWALKVASKLRDARMQNWLALPTLWRIATALKEIGGYPRRHTAYGNESVPGTGLTYLEYATSRIASL